MRGGGSASGHARRQRSQITDPDELREYRMTQRKGFEDAIRMNRVHLGNYVKYAKWEEAQEAFERARPPKPRVRGKRTLDARFRDADQARYRDAPRVLVAAVKSILKFHPQTHFWWNHAILLPLLRRSPHQFVQPVAD